MNNYKVKTNVNTNEVMEMLFKAGRGNEFTAGGLECILDYLESTSENGLIDLDIVGISCQFAEYQDIESLVSDYDSYLDDEEIRDEEDGELLEYEILEALGQYTWICDTGYSYVIYTEF